MKCNKVLYLHPDFLVLLKWREGFLVFYNAQILTHHKSVYAILRIIRFMVGFLLPFGKYCIPIRPDKDLMGDNYGISLSAANCETSDSGWCEKSSYA